MRTLQSPKNALRGLALAAAAGLGLAALVAVSRPAADAGTANGPIEAVFEGARANDTLLLVTTQADGELHTTITVPANSKLTLTANPDKTVAEKAAGLGFRLCDPDGTDLMVAGGPQDKSNLAKDKIKWKNVLLEKFGTYTLIATATTPGGMKAKLAITPKKGKFEDESPDDTELPRNTPESVDFQGRTGDILKFELLKKGKNSKFKGQAIQLLEANGTLRTDIPDGKKGSITLESDGTGTLTFLNDGTQPAGWRSKLIVKPRKDKKRTVLISAAQTGTKPKVNSITPKKGVHEDTALRVTIMGKDFMPGMDVRLAKKNGSRLDILATDINVLSETEANFLLDLDTQFRDGRSSIGTWQMSVWNAPVYADAEDRESLNKETPLKDEKKTFKSIAAGDVKLPEGVEDNTEVWQLVFNDDFQDDLDHMGLGSSNAAVRNAMNEIVQAYTLAYVRDLLLLNETNGNVIGAAVPMSFTIDPITRVAGVAGLDYNRIEVGGTYDSETDPLNPLEPLEWGFAPFDAGNTQRDDLVRKTDDGTILGYGARTGVLDARNGNDQASASWRQAMLPLRQNPLSANDAIFITGQFNPNRKSHIARYTDIVTQVERASREIAAIVAHHIGRAMGLPSPGEGPMAAPSFSGEMWLGRRTLKFSDTSLAALRLLVKPHELPGNSEPLKVVYFPLIDSQPELLEPSIFTGTQYDIKWDYVGGRCNAVADDFRITYARGSVPPLNIELSYEGLSGIAPVCIGGSCTSAGSIYCGVLEFAVIVEDVTRSGGSFLFHRVKVLPTVGLLPPNLQAQGQQCRDTVQNAP